MQILLVLFIPLYSLSSDCTDVFTCIFNEREIMVWIFLNSVM